MDTISDMSSYDKHAQQWAEMAQNGKILVHTYIEKPAMARLLPVLTGKDVLCLGCGSGEEIQLLNEARHIAGLDRSNELLRIARQQHAHAAFRQGDMEQLPYDDETFDVVYSSLALHYVSDYTRTLGEAFRVLRPEGTMLFSTIHPMLWAAQVDRYEGGTRKIMGFEIQQNELTGLYGDYFQARKVHDVWFGEMDVSFYVQPLQDTFNQIIASGLQILQYDEPQPITALADVYRPLYEIYSRLPTFALFLLRKPPTEI